MADVRCPMCGKPNPAEAENCQYCEARLKPLVINPSDAEAEQAGDLESALPDWLQDLRQSGEEQPPAEDLSPERAADQPDWLSGMRAGEPQAKGVDAEPAGEADWLRRLEGDEEHPSGGAAAFQASSPEEQPEAGLSPGPDAEESDLPDWMAGFGRAEPPSEEPGLTGSEAGEAAIQEPDTQDREDADWLARIRARKQAEQPPEELPGEGDVPEGDANLPDWLTGFQESGQEFQDAGEGIPGARIEEGTAEEPTAPEEEAEVPDWIKQAAEEPPARPEEQVEATMPDWLSGYAAAFEVPDDQPEEPAEDVPDWISQYPPSEAEAEEQAALDLDQPEWLSQLEAEDLSEPVPGQPSVNEGQAAPEGEEAVPDWLLHMEGQTPGEPEEDVPASVLAGDDLLENPFTPESTAEEETPDLTSVPEWLSSVAKEEPGPEEPEGGAPLAPADMPGWLAAMRPVESAAPGTPVYGAEATDPENAGPLAGLRGVLPAEPEFPTTRKTHRFSSRLEVTENQQAHIALLMSMLATEKEPRPLPAGAAITPQTILRILIALLLIAGVLGGLWLDQNLLPLPTGTNFPEEVSDAMLAINQVQPGQAVLVAFDYEPGFSGELDATASAALAQLARRGAQMAVVSTSPTGPVMAERVLGNLQSQQGPLPGGLINLGFIPGGPPGLLAFASSPPATVPFAVDGMEAWTTGPMSQVQSVGDFNLVMVITENADTARSWVEQVQPFLQKTGAVSSIPMVMVISAQAEPMVRPYYEANPRQVNGIIAGLAGGAAYESASNQPGLARGYWDAYGIGLLVAAALIVVAGLYNLAVLSLAGQKSQEGETSV